uniref:Uncharacterized protein n=1 Tax=Haptolina ericina TaxID=156174 RepID=A0A7S3C0W3_9EUKA|mmetsp:Transcript_72948/g.162063  ORF Transcript_72948/g.162063 Transcript_72948/m.162063 type:complete len:103 (+) Transcript_72948:3-311(+)
MSYYRKPPPMDEDFKMDEHRPDVLASMRAGTRAWLEQPSQSETLDRIALTLLRGALPAASPMVDSMSQILNEPSETKGAESHASVQKALADVLSQLNLKGTT